MSITSVEVRLLAALKALRADEWRVTVDWGRREPRQAINDECDAAIAAAEALPDENVTPIT